MTRLSWSISIILTLLVSAYASVLLTKAFPKSGASLVSNASSTIAVVTPNHFPPLVFPEILPVPQSTTTKVSAATDTPQKTTAPAQTKKVPLAPTTSTQSSAPAAPPPTVGSSALDAVAVTLRGALVNIVCYVPAGSALHSISGSGIIIDQKGIILTNAHVAQYFLLRNLDVSCVIRAGSPAQDAYTARLIYISPAWITANPDVLTQTNPVGTGEDDFALLGIVQSASNNPLPVSFPAIALSHSAPVADTPIVIASFGAQFLGITQIESSLFPTIVFGSVKQVFTFATNTIDVVDLGGSAAAQEGSSGGGIATAAGTLAGTITTSTTEGATNTRSLSAITASYIRSEYAHETNSTLDVLLAEPLSVSISDFAPKIPALEATITASLH